MWNFKGTLWNSTQNILPIHWKMWLLNNIEILRALRFKSSYAFLKRPPGRRWPNDPMSSTPELQKYWSLPTNYCTTTISNCLVHYRDLSDISVCIRICNLYTFVGAIAHYCHERNNHCRSYMYIHNWQVSWIWIAKMIHICSGVW